jgi:hypothetical protein
MGHHMRHAVHQGSNPGRTRGNPFHEECMKIARLIGLDLSINCVYDREGQLSRVIGGPSMQPLPMLSTSVLRPLV